MEKKVFSSHVSSQLNRNLEELFHHILEMGGMVENQLDMALSALGNGDVKIAKEVLRFDKTINQAEMEIDRLCIRVLARQQPTASDLRLILSTIRIAIDLERMGDEICKLAKLVVRFNQDDESPCARFAGYAELVDITTRAREMLKVTLNAFARVSAEDAMAIFDQEDEVDQIYNKARAEVTQQFKDMPDKVECLLEVTSALRASERLTDHSLNIMESIIYLVQGKDVRNMDQERLTHFLEKHAEEL